MELLHSATRKPGKGKKAEATEMVAIRDRMEIIEM